jgi:hypothetical protein
MIEDPIIKNIHRIRIEYAERYGNDLHRIFEAARKKQGADGRLVVSATPKPMLNQHIEENTA